MPDPFANVTDTLSTPARSSFAVTPSDSTDFLNTGIVPKRLYVTTGGTLAVQMLGDAGSISLGTVAAGFLDLRVRKVLSTGTTATGIFGFY